MARCRAPTERWSQPRGQIASGAVKAAFPPEAMVDGKERSNEGAFFICALWDCRRFLSAFYCLSLPSSQEAHE
jgi:hypothetical protein